MCNAKNAKETFEIALAGCEGTYTYSGIFAKKGEHDPWVWTNKTKPSAPHLTAYANGFTFVGEVKSFHLTYPFNGQAHKPVHVYFKVGSKGTVTFSHVDAKRCGSDADAAELDVTNRKDHLISLASALLKGAMSG